MLRPLLTAAVLSFSVLQLTACRVEPSEGEGEGEGEGGDVIVIADDFVAVDFLPFGGSNSQFAVDTTEHHSGTASVRFDIPASAYAGGALVADEAVDVSAFNAVTFYAKVNAGTHTINVFGFGNDAGSGVEFAVERPAVALTTEWQRVVLPIPVTGRLTAQQGLFHFAEGSDEGAYALFIDDLRYTTIEPGVVTNPRPAIATVAVTRGIGESTTVAGQAITYAAQDNGAATASDFLLSPVAARYFSYASSDAAVATVDALGVITAVAAGSATISASLGATAAAGAVTVTIAGVVQTPTDVATAPTYNAGNAISLFSTHYTNVPVTTFRADFSAADLADFAIPGAGRTVKRYTLRNFVGIEMLDANVIDANGMTAFSMAVWTPDITSLLVKLVDLGTDGAFGGGDDAIVELTIPITTQNDWTTVEVPFSTNAAFQGGHIAQVIIDGLQVGGNTLYVDDMLFHN